MTVTDAQNLILLEVGAGLDGLDSTTRTQLDKVTPNIGLLWQKYSFKAYYPGLQELWVKWGAINILLGQLRLKINATVGPLNRPLEAIWNHLLMLRKETREDIQEMEKRAAASRGAVGAQISATSPLTGDDLTRLILEGEQSMIYPDPNSPRYLGVPGFGRNSPDW